MAFLGAQGVSQKFRLRDSWFAGFLVCADWPYAATAHPSPLSRRPPSKGAVAEEMAHGEFGGEGETATRGWEGRALVNMHMLVGRRGTCGEP